MISGDTPLSSTPDSELASLSLVSVDSELTAQDMARVEELLRSGVRSTDSLPRELGDYLVASGGKRVRPLLMILTYRGFAHPSRSARISIDDLHVLASVAEWTHTATLFHDDVLDASEKRRDQASAHMLHGNKVAILVGDFVYAEAFALLMERGLLEASRELAFTIKQLVEGELLQHKIVGNRSLNGDEYERIARAKTAALFAWCTGTGAWGAGLENHGVAKDFGALLGYAFQMADDLFDTYSLDAERASEAELVEWAESAPPLPVVVAGAQDSGCAAAWRELPLVEPRNLRGAIVTLLSHCLKAPVIVECERRIQACFAEAHLGLKSLGDNPALAQALTLIEARAEQGLSTARSRREPGGSA